MIYLTIRLFKRLFLHVLAISLFFPVVLCAETRFSKEETVLLSNAVGFAAITGWGILNWDYFQKDPRKADEGWFSEHAGYSNQEGAFWGSLSAFGLTTWMEIGDSFSDYGFSYEDALMNLAGSLTGYLLYTRGYSENRSRERNVYLGLGLNISRIFDRLSMPKVSKAAQYIQIPYTYIETRRDLNR